MTDSIINQAIAAVIDMAEEIGLFAPIGRGPLDADPGIRVELSPGNPPLQHLDRRGVVHLSLVINAKHRDMQLLSNMLHRIHDTLTRAEDYPCTEAWQITHITTESLPELIGREPGDMWLYASALTVTLYY